MGYKLDLAKITLFVAALCVAISAHAGAMLPVLLIRGLDHRDVALRPLQEKLQNEGFANVRVAAFTPRHGTESIELVAKQAEEVAQQLMKDTGSKQIDVIGFSMGALAARYVIQRLGGKTFVRKFISISGPQLGTWSAYVRMFHVAVREMAPNSNFLKDLERDKDPFGKVELYSFYTPYDIIVFPAKNSILPNSTVKSFHVTLHHQMLKDPEVLDAVVHALREGPHAT